MARLFPLLVLSLLCASVVTVRYTRVAAMERFVETRSYEDLYYLPPPSWLEVMSLGHREALADLIWMRGLIYVGEEFGEGGGLTNIFRYSESMLTLDPDFRRAYTWVGVAGLYRPVEVTTEDIQTTVDFLKRGAERFPRDGELKWDLGTTMMYELARRFEGDERAAIEREATEYLVQAARLGAAPEYIALNNATHLREQGRLDLAIRHLEEMYVLVDDEATRASILQRLTEMRSAAEAGAIDASRQRFSDSWRANYPWLPASFFAIVGPPIPDGYLPPELASDPFASEPESESEPASPTP